ncbi:MAG: hypothetical protein JWM57_1503 [Phycisphaerales bacterium]|nr:hypothetical protein [Phycisphaerales bacterium]
MRAAPYILCLAVAGLSHSSHSAEPTAQPPVPQVVAPSNVAAATPQLRASYLGVMTSVATPALREQLSLPGGVGVLIEAVDAESPAQRGGLQVHDIIMKLDDQLVINVHQFGVLVRMRKPGETISLSVIRRGKPITANVALADRAFTPGDDLVAITNGPPHGSGRLNSIVTQNDGTHEIILTTHGDADRHVRIATTHGEVLFDGPLNTADDRAHVPADCRAKVDTIEKNWERFKQLRNIAPAAKPPAAPAPATPGEK